MMVCFNKFNNIINSLFFFLILLIILSFKLNIKQLIGTIILSNVLKNNKSIEVLDLSGNNIR